VIHYLEKPESVQKIKVEFNQLHQQNENERGGKSNRCDFEFIER